MSEQDIACNHCHKLKSDCRCSQLHLELEEQARLLGISGSREAKLLAEREEARKEAADWCEKWTNAGHEILELKAQLEEAREEIEKLHLDHSKGYYTPTKEAERKHLKAQLASKDAKLGRAVVSVKNIRNILGPDTVIRCSQTCDGCFEEMSEALAEAKNLLAELGEEGKDGK